MRRTMILSGLVPATVALIAVSFPSAASAHAEPTGRAFGAHVAECAQTMGFDSAHNPGMHSGFSGWDGMPC